MEAPYMKATVFLILLFFCMEGAGAVSFTMERSNASTGGYVALDSNNTVYRGDTVKFTPSGGSDWVWGFGDGFSSIEEIPEHIYGFGKHPIIMSNGVATLEVSLLSGGVETTDHINYTTLLPLIVTQAETIATMNESLSENYTEALTGNRTAPPGWSGFDWVRGVDVTAAAYTSVLTAPLFLMIIFAIPFVMSWIISKDFVVPGIIGGFLGVFIIARLPANLQLLAVAFIVMSVVAVIYSLLKET